MTGQVREQGPGVRLRDPLERHLVREGLASQVRQVIRNHITVGELDVAVAHDDEQRRVRRRPDDMSQEQQRGLVCPVQIIDHQQCGRSRGDPGQQRCDRLEQPVALGLRVAHRRQRSFRGAAEETATSGEVLLEALQALVEHGS